MKHYVKNIKYLGKNMKYCGKQHTHKILANFTNIKKESITCNLLTSLLKKNCGKSI